MVVILKVLFLKKLRLGGKIRERAFVAYKHLKKRFNSRSLRPAFFCRMSFGFVMKKSVPFEIKLQYSRLVPVAKTSKRAPVPAKRGVNRSYEHVTHRCRCKDLIHKFNQLRLKDEL